MTNRETFQAAYAERLAAAVAKNPAEYGAYYAPTVIRGNAGNTTLPVASVVDVAARMTAAAARGNISLSGNTTLRATCKALGIPQNITGVMTFLATPTATPTEN